MLKQILCSSYLRITLLLFSQILSLGSIFYSYTHTSANIASHMNTLFQKTKEEITEALDQFSAYLTLTESRLIKSQGSKVVLTKILTEKPEILLDKNFPTIIRLAFVPASQPKIAYTRFGTQHLEQAITLDGIQNVVLYLGNGTFRIEKTIFDKNKKKFGILQSTFSLGYILGKNFPEKEIYIFPSKEHNFSKDNLSFAVENFPYTFVKMLSPLSFWQFLFEFKYQIISWIIFSFFLYLTGIATGTSISSKFLLKSHSQNKKLKKKLKSIDKEKEDFAKKLNIAQKLLKLKERSQIETRLLFQRLHTNYQQMGAQAKAINKMTSKLISDVTGNNAQMKEILKLSEDSNVVLNHLINGFPMRAVEDRVDVPRCIENIKMIFFPQLTELGVQFEVRGEIKSPLQFDKTIIEIVLHNIFYIITDRLAKNNVFEIELKDNESIEIIFLDNGYDVMNRSNWFTPHQNNNDTLFMEKDRLQDFIHWLGWKILFRTEGDLNIIKLSIPRALKNNISQNNVINLFGNNPDVT